MANHNIQHLQHLLERSQVFAGFHYLNNLGPTPAIPDRQQILLDLQHKIDTAKELTANINDILKSGDYPKALGKLKKAQFLVRDFPNIQTDIDFITASISTMEKNLREAKILARKGDRHKVDEILKTAQSIDKNNNAITEVNRRLYRRRRKKGVKTVLIALLVIVVPSVYFSFEQLTLQQAGNLWVKAESLIATKQYAKAEALITQMDNRLQFVRVLGQADKIHLLEKASLFNSEAQDEKGSKDSGNKRYVKSLLAKASVKVAIKDYPEALGIYDEALLFSAANIHIDKEMVRDIKGLQDSTRKAYQVYLHQQQIATLKILTDTAQTLFRNDSWQQAAVAYGQALDFGKGIDGISTSSITLLKQGMITSTINTHIENGEIAFNQSRYIDAIESFEQCLTFMESKHLEGNHLYSNLIDKLDQVKQKEFNVKLARLVDQGDELYHAKEYDLSIDNYQRGLMLLASSNGEILGDKTRIVQHRIEKKIARAKENVLVQTQFQYLVSTYKKILRLNFNLSRNIHFKKPEIVFLGNMDNHLVYTVSAFGSKSRSASAIKYEIDYKFNLNTGKWQVNDIRLEV